MIVSVCIFNIYYASGNVFSVMCDGFIFTVDVNEEFLFNASTMRIKSMWPTSAYAYNGRGTFIVAVYTCRWRISMVCHASMILQCGAES